MILPSPGVVCKSCFLLLLLSLAVGSAFAQLESATVSGQVVDPSGLNITGALVKLVDIDHNTTTGTHTNPSGLYTFPSVRPSRYRMEVTVAGFKVVNVTGLTVNVQDHLEQNFKLAVGSVSESVTVEGGAPVIDTESATVSTVVDRNFAENLPMNGRSFQTLIQLTPGVVLTVSNANDSGQFSVNGQRASSNYWMVDGVSANIGVSSGNNPGNGLAGALGSFSAAGGTNSLVSVDAMQEFRIQTSTYAPEFGRTPGGQISIVTRSGTNQFHGSLFDYFRNDALDASDWFNGYTNIPPLPKAQERQNDFGGTLSGPVLKDRTFFFFSYEGLRLRLPQTTLTTVPDLSARQNAMPAIQPYLNAFPLPNGPEVPSVPGAAEFNLSYSNPASLDAYSLRIDHKMRDNLTIFGRYNYSPSESDVRGAVGGALSMVQPSRITTQTGTIGSDWMISPTITNDLRFNYSRTNAASSYQLDNFGGAVPLTFLPFPAGFNSQNASFSFFIVPLTGNQFRLGANTHNLQRQINFVDNLAVQKGSHSLKVGIDFRRLSPLIAPPAYAQGPAFLDVPSAETGSSFFGQVVSSAAATLLFHNLGVFAQDTWHLSPRLSLTYGLRWDVDFAPSSLDGPSIPAVTGYSLTDFSRLAMAPAGTVPFKTTYGNVAPRLGLAYQVRQKEGWGTVLRGGWGIFYDLASSEAGSAISAGNPPFAASNFFFGDTFPFDPALTAAVPIPSTGSISALYVFNPNLKLPYTLEWNVAVEQSLGKQQTVSASYIGAAGRRLLQTTAVAAAPPTNPNVGTVNGARFIDNTASSDYDALQIQFQRRLSHGVQALVSYSWAHSIDTGSAGSTFYGSNAGSGATSNANRGPSDFDVRRTFSAGLTYNMPVPRVNAFTDAILHGWSLQSIVQARSAPPVDVSDFHFFFLDNGLLADVRPDLVPGQPLYLNGAQCAATLVQPLVPTGQPVPPCPGGMGLNPAAFTDPPVNPSTLVPLRNGDLGRNALRGFGAVQWDLAVHRDFSLHESLKLQFRAEMFNVLNHPNFGQPNSQWGTGGFGVSSQVLAQYLNGGGIASNIGGGAFSPLYQIGGPRSIQLAIKFQF